MAHDFINKANFKTEPLKDQIILITGGGGGIGYETARALVYLGAIVIIAEIDQKLGGIAEDKINQEFGAKRAHFIHTDVGEEQDIIRLKRIVHQRFCKLDAIINNATITPIGAVHEVNIADWDRSYKVNMRATVLLTQYFLPEMLERDSGTIVFVSSSGAAPYMGAYEVFKMAQVEICHTLSYELEETNVITYTIGPGLIKTKTAHRAITKVAKRMGMSVEDFYAINSSYMLNVKLAGTGVAASLVMADRYHGQETSSIQALMDAGIVSKAQPTKDTISITENKQQEILERILKIITTYSEQYQGWLERNIFERQWVLRDFKRNTGISAEHMLIALQDIGADSIDEFTLRQDHLDLINRLKNYYIHQRKLLQNYEKNPEKLQAHTAIIDSWIADFASIEAITQ